MELLLGKTAGDISIQSFLSRLADDGSGPSPERRSFPALKSRPACEYWNYKDFGLSLCFESSVLEGIHVYNGRHGYSRFKGELPQGLRLEMTGREIVNLLGEPDVKIGGGRGGAVSIGYLDKGLQINFVGSDWEDRDNAVDCVTIYKPEMGRTKLDDGAVLSSSLS